MSILTKIKNALELIKLSFEMSPANFFVVLLGSLIAASKSLVIVFFPAVVVEMFISKKTFNSILIIIAVYASIILIADASEKAFSLLSTALGYKGNNKATLRVGQKSMRMDYAKWSEEEIFNKGVKAKTSTWIFSNTIDMLCENWICSIFTLIPVLYILSKLHYSVVIAISVLSIIELVVERKVDNKTHSLEEIKSKFNKKAQYNEQILSEIKYGKELRLYNSAWENIIEKFSQSKNDLLQITMKQRRLELLFQVLVTILSSFKEMLAYIFAVFQYLNGSISISQFLVFSGAIYQFTDAIKTFFETFNFMGELTEYYLDYKNFMNIPNNDADLNSDIDINFENDIELKNVWFRYYNTEKYALKNINLRIPYGSRIAIVGENGSGKTTLVKIIMRLYDINEGTINIDDNNIYKFNRDKYWKLFAPVFQDYILHPFSLRENLSFSDKDNDKILWDLLSHFSLYDRVKNTSKGLDTFVTKQLDSEGTDFSGGERQKLAMVRAMYKGSPILVLDEPTAAMDPISELKYFDILQKETESKTALFITHRLASTKFADNIIVMDKGEIVEEGTFDDLIRANGTFSKLFGLQASYYQIQN